MKDMEEKFPRALWVRLFVYLVVGHVFAAFVYFLFEAGPARVRPTGGSQSLPTGYGGAVSPPGTQSDRVGEPLSALGDRAV